MKKETGTVEKVKCCQCGSEVDFSEVVIKGKHRCFFCRKCQGEATRKMLAARQEARGKSNGVCHWCGRAMSEEDIAEALARQGSQTVHVHQRCSDVASTVMKWLRKSGRIAEAVAAKESKVAPQREADQAAAREAAEVAAREAAARQAAAQPDLGLTSAAVPAVPESAPVRVAAEAAARVAEGAAAPDPAVDPVLTRLARVEALLEKLAGGAAGVTG